MEKLLLTVRETASLLGISLPTAYKLVHQKGFPTVSIGCSLKVDRNGLKEWIESHWN